MNEFNKLVAHVINLKKQEVEEVTFNVDYLIAVLKTIAPTMLNISANDSIERKPADVNDAGTFAEE